MDCESSDDELIKPTNPNKFTLDPENGGGRIHRLHNVSRIAHLKNGKEGLKSCVVDLFGCRAKKIDDSPSSHEDRSLPFSRITEEKCEESPSQHFSSLKQGSVMSQCKFKLQPRTCGEGLFQSLQKSFDTQQKSQKSDVRMHQSKESISSTLKKDSSRKANRPNLHSAKPSSFE